MQLKTPILFFLSFLLFFFSQSCQNELAETKVPQADTQVKIPAFNTDSAYVWVEKQVAFGPRYTNSPGHAQVRDWLLQKVDGYADEVIRQDFSASAYTGDLLNGTNVIARYKPEVAERVLLCAHYDTRHIADKDSVDQDEPILGADDGASGVAVLLEIARQLKENPIPMGVDIIFFDAEDYGEDDGAADSWCLGSQHWSRNLHEPGYEVKYGILLDMVGAKNAQFTKEGNSRSAAKPIVNKIWDLAKLMKKEQYFIDENTSPIVDDHYFIIKNTGIPMVDIINHPPGDKMFEDYHHTHQDNLGIIDRASLQAVGQVTLAVVYKESNKQFTK